MVTIYSSYDGIIIIKMVNHSFPFRPIFHNITRRTLMCNTVRYGNEGIKNTSFSPRKRDRLSTTPWMHFRSNRKTDRYLDVGPVRGDT